MIERRDLVVIGGGAMGTAAAWQAARRGLSVTLLERFAAGHNQGASHGSTRNFNQAYSDPEYVRLVEEAATLWAELESEAGRTLIDRVGLVNHGQTAVLDATEAALSSCGIANELVSAREAQERWPQFRFRTNVLMLPQSGRVRAADALTALRTTAEARGADFRFEEPATSVLVKGDNRVVVETGAAVYEARRVIIAVGAWSEKLFSDLLVLPRLRVTQEQPVHFAPTTTDLWPSFNHFPDPNEPDDHYWLSPVYGMATPGEGIKAGWHGVGPVTDPDRRTFQAVPDQLAVLQRYAEEWLPGVDSRNLIPISCTYTTTDTENFVLERTGPIVIAAGFSGHGFKFTPAIGRILVDLAEGRQSPAIFRHGVALRNQEGPTRTARSPAVSH